jgi:hypothetical protein
LYLQILVCGLGCGREVTEPFNPIIMERLQFGNRLPMN